MKIAGAVLAVVGAVLVIAGCILGFSSVSRQGVGCGSGFGGVDSQAVTTAGMERAMEGAPMSLNTVDGECASAVSDRKTVTYVVLVPGALLTVVGWYLWLVARQQERAVA